MPELKPCPFCGESAICKKTRAHEWVIGCDGRFGSACPGYIWKMAPVYFTKKEATTAWNRRNKLRLLEYGDMDTLQSAMMPAT